MGAVFKPERFSMKLLPGVTGLGTNVAVTPAGNPLAVKIIGVAKPPETVVVMVLEAVLPQPTTTGVAVPKLKVTGEGMILKLASEISKKIFPNASIFILAVVLTGLGITSISAPSFAVLAESTVG